MKINKIYVNNFRNLKDLTIDVQPGTSIISGVNKLGKSNLLNSLMWFLTDTLLTDKYGTGENDVDSIVPIDFQKKQHTEVTIYFENGQKFTKLYKTTYKRGTNEINGHTTDYSINDIPQQNSTTFKEELFKILNFTPVFTKLKIKELNAFIDPLYLLQKLNPKELRAFLVTLGCSVSNEELYALGFEKMRKYEEQYLGKWDNMRTDYKKKVQSVIDSLEKEDAILEKYANVEVFDGSLLSEYNAKQEKLISTKTNLLNRTLAVEMLELQQQKNNISFNKNNYVIQQEKIKSSNLQQMRQNIASFRSLNNAQKEEKSLEYRLLKKDIEQQKVNHQKNVDAIKLVITQNENIMKNALDTAKLANAKKRELSQRLVEIQNRQYQGYITCPHCGESFAANEEDLLIFEKNRQADQEFTIQEMTNCTNSSNAEKAKYDAAKALIEQEQDKLNAMHQEDYDKKLNYLDNMIASIPDNQELIDKAIAKEKAIAEEKTKTIDTSSFDVQLEEIEQKIQTFQSMGEEQTKEEIIKVNYELDSINNLIKEQIVLENSYNEKIKIEQNIYKLQQELNDLEQILNLTDSFIQKMISMINERATAKLGINFVMLEDNLTNDGVTEVCYATVEGIPFKDVNTSEKIAQGIALIEKIKLIANTDFGVAINDLPILADRLESVDTDAKIRNFTLNQFICTKVTTSQNMQVN